MKLFTFHNFICVFILYPSVLRHVFLPMPESGILLKRCFFYFKRYQYTKAEPVIPRINLDLPLVLMDGIAKTFQPVTVQTLLNLAGDRKSSLKTEFPLIIVFKPNNKKASPRK